MEDRGDLRTRTGSETSSARTHADRSELDALARLRRRLLGIDAGIVQHDEVDALVPAMPVGAYRLLHPIGRGGMGEVWLAHDPRLDRKVAIKVVRHRSARDGENARLVREARAIAQIGHPNVISIYDTGTIGDADSPMPRAYIAMEYIEGCSLDIWLRSAPRSQAEIVAVFIAAGRGLVAAHRVGQVHRDFKPPNVMIGPAGDVKVLDFGIAMTTGCAASGASADTDVSARVRADDGITGRLTETGVVMGTPRYMSPEQHAGGVVTAASDQFSFSCALLEALQRGPVFVGHGAVQLARAKLRGIIVPGPIAVPRRLRAVLVRGLDRDPERRWPSMEALLEQLSRPRARRSLVTLVAGVVALGGIAATAAARSECAPRPPVVSDAVAAEVLAQHTDDHASATALVATLRDHDARLTRLEVDTCVAHRSGTVADDVLDRRVACIRDRRRDLETTAMFLATRDAIGASATTIADGLTDVGACADDSSSVLAIAPPADIATARAIDRARSHLSSARVLRLAGLFRDALAEVTDARAAVAAVDYPPIDAELDFTQGQIQLESDDPAAAETLERALVRAESVGHERLAADIAAALVNAAVREPSSRERLPTILRRADAIIQRAGDPAIARGDYWMALATMHTKRGEFERSLDAAEQAHAVYATTLDAEHRKLDAARFNSGIALLNLRRFEDGTLRLAEVVARRERALGPTHASTIAALAVLGVAHAHANELDEADTKLREAVDRAESASGALHPELPFALGALGDVARRRDRTDESRTFYLRALALAEEREGPLGAETATLAGELGDIERRLGRLDDARAHLVKSRAGHEHMLGHEHALVAEALRRLAEVELLANEPDEARAHARESLGILAALRATPEQLAPGQRVLADAELALASR